MGETSTIDLLANKNVKKFTEADDGKTFTYQVEEVNDGKPGYIYDEGISIVTLTVEDNQNATLTLTTAVIKDGKETDRQIITTGDTKVSKATIAFENVYDAIPVKLGGEGNVSINAKKTLVNREMADGEFTFNVLDKAGNIVTSGTNDDKGNIIFDTIEYTTSQLNEDVKTGLAIVDQQTNALKYIYSYQYTVVEDETRLDEGVTGIVTSFNIQVVITDNGDGTLDIEVMYPESSEGQLVFENIYGLDTAAEISLNGEKILRVVSGDRAPDITGKYEFTLTAEDGAPMPERTVVTNDAGGNVNFGKVRYTMENVFGQDEPATSHDVREENDPSEMETLSKERTKTFTYTVTETGSIAGVTNDETSSKSFTVTVTDHGDGTLSVTKNWDRQYPFSFVNSYHVKPIEYSLSTDVTINKVLDGRAMKDGEFEFELLDEKNDVVARAVNDAKGAVKYEALEYTVPGEYVYSVREKNTGLGGVEYDTTVYRITVTVTDHGDGTLSALAATETTDEIIFKNQYTPASTTVTLGASKLLQGRNLAEEEFTFQLKDAKGSVVAQTKNNANGQILFETMAYDKAGVYAYTISEVDDSQKNITYDSAEYQITVTVTDDGNGYLRAEVTGDTAVFKNVYTKPEEPKKPETTTGDTANLEGYIYMAVVSCAGALAVVWKKRKSRLDK